MRLNSLFSWRESGARKVSRSNLKIIINWFVVLGLSHSLQLKLIHAQRYLKPNISTHISNQDVYENCNGLAPGPRVLLAWKKKKFSWLFFRFLQYIRGLRWKKKKTEDPQKESERECRAKFTSRDVSEEAGGKRRNYEGVSFSVMRGTYLVDGLVFGILISELLLFEFGKFHIEIFLFHLNLLVFFFLVEILLRHISALLEFYDGLQLLRVHCTLGAGKRMGDF